MQSMTGNHAWLSAGARHGARIEILIARSITMLDVVLIAAALAFFALSLSYVLACDRL